jgi:putative peptidoglycan lipid II flippase
VQVNIFVSTIFASREPGAVASLQFAFRLLYLPIGVFGVAVGTIATTGLARRAAEGDAEGVRATLGRSLRMLAFLTIPATAGLMTLAVPIVRLLFERGNFRPEATLNTAAALKLYSIGLVAYTSVKVLAPAFYALGTPRVPLVASASAVVTNLALILTLHGSLSFRAIALGTALGSWANAAVLIAVFESRQGGLVRQIATSPVARMVAAALIMAGASWAAARGLEAWLGTAGSMARIVVGLAPVLLGGGVYLAGARALNIPEARELIAVVWRRPSR